MLIEVPLEPLPVEAEVYLKKFIEEYQQKKDVSEREDELMLDLVRRAYSCGVVQTEHRLLKNTTLGQLEKIHELFTKFLVACIDIAHSSSHKQAVDKAQEALKSFPMTIDDVNEQRASFAFGQLAMTSDYHDASPEKLAGLKKTCRRLAGCREEESPCTCSVEWYWNCPKHGDRRR